VTSGDGRSPQIDPEDIALAVPFLEQLDDALADPHRRLPRPPPRPQAAAV
jgi:hypothetical protein